MIVGANGRFCFDTFRSDFFSFLKIEEINERKIFENPLGYKKEIREF